MKTVTRGQLVHACFHQLMAGTSHDSHKSKGLQVSVGATDFLGTPWFSIKGSYEGKEGKCTANALLSIFEKHGASLSHIHKLGLTNPDNANCVMSVLDQVLDGASEKNHLLRDGVLRIHLDGYRKVSIQNPDRANTTLSVKIEGSSLIGRRIANAFFGVFPHIAILTGIDHIDSFIADARSIKMFAINREDKHLFIANHKRT